ncbi:hypothetical protein JY651_32980 [Pyxidicoccus parkwayensis]|uniref:Uncharacterized protein n=1 Tax=Pyxidicoccus parkwayensis TaxID=2813578 RepID=A0ABX7NNS0_9BACT|nr:hypothetical protein [Pyxidicoccus parkwaysis]QSQ20068.1 hypothetical protein JY651_32980 [Pyxidicoccus parkwaysis]
MPGRFTVMPDDTRWSVMAGPVTAGPGFLVDVPYEGAWRRRPSLHFEAPQDEDLRLMSGGQPLLWIRIHPRWHCRGVLRGVAKPPFPWGLPPILATQVRGIAHEPCSDGWWEGWAHHFLRQLEDADASLLHSGRWCLRPMKVITEEAAEQNIPLQVGLGNPPPPPYAPETALRFERFEIKGWRRWTESECGWPFIKRGDVLALRAPSSAEDGRVKAWRKHARDGTLPPVLMFYARLADMWLVLDGHDRLHAAVLEGKAPPVLGLWTVTEMLGRPGWPSMRLAVTRAWPMKEDAWRSSILEAYPKRPPGTRPEDWDGLFTSWAWPHVRG